MAIFQKSMSGLNCLLEEGQHSRDYLASARYACWVLCDELEQWTWVD